MAAGLEKNLPDSILSFSALQESYEVGRWLIIRQHYRSLAVAMHTHFRHIDAGSLWGANKMSSWVAFWCSAKRSGVNLPPR